MTRIEIIQKLVDKNQHETDGRTCHGDIECQGISCYLCPLKIEGITMGSIREELATQPAFVPDCSTTEKSDSDDGVKAPSHYMLFEGVESIQIIARSMTIAEFKGFCLGNVLKYRLRAGKKSELASMEKDLNKAEFYKELFARHKGECHDAI